MADLVDEETEDREIAELEAELGALERESLDLDDDCVRLTCEVSDKKESLFKQLQMNSMYRRWMGSSVDMFHEKQMENFEREMMCPMCGERRCDAVVRFCGHPFCSVCAAKFGGSCPTCEEKVKEVVNFLYTP
jgi:formate dehydrogenase maturation protein FdhE